MNDLVGAAYRRLQVIIKPTLRHFFVKEYRYRAPADERIAAEVPVLRGCL